MVNGDNLGDLCNFEANNRHGGAELYPDLGPVWRSKKIHFHTGTGECGGDLNDGCLLAKAKFLWHGNQSCRRGIDGFEGQAVTGPLRHHLQYLFSHSTSSLSLFHIQFRLF